MTNIFSVLTQRGLTKQEYDYLFAFARNGKEEFVEYFLQNVDGSEQLIHADFIGMTHAELEMFAKALGWQPVSLDEIADEKYTQVLLFKRREISIVTEVPDYVVGLSLMDNVEVVTSIISVDGKKGPLHHFLLLKHEAMLIEAEEFGWRFSGEMVLEEGSEFSRILFFVRAD